MIHIIPECVSLNNEYQVSDVEAKMIDGFFERSIPLPLHTAQNINDVFEVDSCVIDRNLDTQFMTSMGHLRQIPKLESLRSQRVHN